MSWKRSGLVHHHVGTFSEPTDEELAAYGWEHYKEPQNTRGTGPIEHGTSRGYKKHWRRGERPCDRCLAAHRKSTANYRADRRRAA